MSRTRTTYWNLLFHYVAIAIMFVTGVVLVPLYLLHIPSNIYGYWLATGNMLAWVALIDPGFSTILQQRVGRFYGAGDTLAVSEYLGSAAVLSFGMLAAGLVLGLGIGLCLPAILGIQGSVSWSEVRGAFIWSAGGMALSMASFPLTAGAQGLQGSLGPGLVYAVTQLGALGVTVWGLHYDLGVRALGIANFVRGAGLFAGAVGYLLWRVKRGALSWHLSATSLKEVLVLSSFSLLAKVSSTFAGQIDMVVATRFFGPEAATMFSLTRRGHDITRMFAERPTVALMPAIAHLGGEGSDTKLRELILRMVWGTLWTLGLLFGGFVAFNDDFMRLWVGDAFYAGTLVNLLLGVGTVVAVIVNGSSNLSIALGDLRGSSMAHFGISCVTLASLACAALTSHLAVLAAAPLIGMLSVGICYFPRALWQRVQMRASFISEFSRECLIVVLSTGVVTSLALLAGPASWVSFTCWVIGFVLVYSTCILCASAKARSQARLIIEGLRKSIIRGR